MLWKLLRTWIVQLKVIVKIDSNDHVVKISGVYHLHSDKTTLKPKRSQHRSQ